ncbi:MAG: tyrosine-type recombinase/integrase [Vulcanimicrobiota bacterium]
MFYSERTIFIRSGKEDKDRYVCADPKTFEMLKIWQGDKGPDALIFEISDRQVQRIVDKYGEMTGISQKYEAMGRSFSPHSFRHAFATHCAENGMDLFTLKKLMGHAFLETTELYVATSMEKAKREYEGSHELMGGKKNAQPKKDQACSYKKIKELFRVFLRCFRLFFLYILSFAHL